MTGIFLTAISAVFLGLTVTIDKLMVGDFYQSRPTIAWFISSLLGLILGLGATAFAWASFGSGNMLLESLQLMRGDTLWLGLLMILAGMLVSLTLLSYFHCFSGTVSSAVAMAIAATPIFVFVLQLITDGGGWNHLHVVSLLVTVVGLIGFGMSSGYEGQWSWRVNWPLLGVIFFGTCYLVLIDALLPVIQNNLGTDQTQTALLSMPWYWIGFALGTISISQREVREFLTTIWNRWHFLALILVVEVIGAGFYFFEFFGLSEINATLVALIVGAHVILVWLFDIYIRNLYQKARIDERDMTTILFFKLPTKNLEEYDISSKTLWFQAGFILLTLAGLTLWP